MRKKKYKPFSQLSRNKQGKQYYQVKNQIRRVADMCGGGFESDHQLEPDQKFEWTRVTFLSRVKPLYYRAKLRTTRFAYSCAVSKAASDRVWGTSEREGLSMLDFGKRNPLTGNFEIDMQEYSRALELSGWWEEVKRADREEEAIANEGVDHVHEQWVLDLDSRYGIGLDVTLNVPYMTIYVIQGFIDRFLESEENYRNPEPFTYRYDEINN